MKKKPTPPPPARQNRWFSYVLMPICALVLVTGFFFAGRQHFSSMDYGMKNSRLRKQIDELEAEKRRLLHNREISLSPAELKRIGKKAGMIDASAVEPEMARATPPTIERTAISSKPEKSMIVKTAAVSSAAATRMNASLAKDERIEKPTKRAGLAE